MMNEGPLGENDEKMMREKARTSGFISDFTRCIRLHSVISSTCEDLIKYFNNATAIYTQSDEITLIFPHGVKMFSGRVQKIATIGSSYTSVRFNHHLSVLSDENVPRGKVGTAHFDCRIFNVPTSEELLNNVIWRCNTDCRRNSKSQFARQYFSASQLLHMTSDQQTDAVEERFGQSYDKCVPDWAKNGTTFKKCLVEELHANHKTKELELCKRTRVTRMYTFYDKLTPGLAELLTSKYHN
jgi:tRNA(His) 5'-end guanylyltransferase